MRAIKRFDLFPKIILENEYKSSILGAIFSIIVVKLLIFLIIRETYNFFSPLIIREAVVQNTLVKENPYISLNLRVKLFNTPCPIVSLDLENLMGNHKMNIREGSNFYRFSKKLNTIIYEEFSPYQLNSLEKSIDEEESCIIDANLNLDRSPGDIHISYHKFRDVYDKLKEKFNCQGIFQKLNLSHKIYKFSFSDEKLIKKIKSDFSLTNTDMIDFINKFETNDFNFPDSDNKHKNKISNYEYYFKLIPHIFYNEYNEEFLFTYLYSMSYTEKPKLDDEEMPMIMMNYDFCPITMKFTLKKKSLLHFLTNICAIIGGIFVFFKILLNILNCVKND